jgi:methylglyoxal synthase
MKPRIALIAHDKKKDDMIALAGEYRDFLAGCTLTATGTTGGRLHQRSSAWKWTASTRVRSAATCRSAPMLVNGEIDCVIFLRDPMTPQPHEPDINALVRACDVHNIAVRDQCLEFGAWYCPN